MIWTSKLRHRLFEELGSITEIRHIAVNQGQMEHREDAASRIYPSVQFPALLITPLGEEAVDRDKETTKYRLTVELRLYVDEARRANRIAPTDHIEAWDNALELVERIISAGERSGLHLDSWQQGIREESLCEWIITLSRMDR